MKKIAVSLLVITSLFFSCGKEKKEEESIISNLNKSLKMNQIQLINN